VNMIRKLFISLLVILLVGVFLATGCVQQSQPKGWSGGIVANGTLFLGSTEGKLVAIDVSSHNRLWSDVPLETSKPAATFGCAVTPAGVAIYGTPAVSGDLVYIGGYNGKLYAVNISNGKREWQYPLAEREYLQPIAGGPVVTQGKVYFGCANGKVYTLDANSGAKEWEFETGDKIWTTPAIHNDTLYIGSFDKKLYAIEAAEGKKRWEFETEGAIVCPPLVYNNTVYFGSFDRYFYAVDTTDGSLRWRSEIEAGSWFWAKPIIYNNMVYAPCLDNKVYILSADSGHEAVDAIDLGSSIASSPVLVDGTIIIGTEEGKVYALDTKTNKSRPLPAELKGKIYAPLFASERVVYVHTQEPDTLYALNAQTGATLWSLPLSSK